MAPKLSPKAGQLAEPGHHLGGAGRRRGPNRLGKIRHRRLHAALLVRHPGELQPHLHAGQSAEHRQLVGVAEMADAEGLARQLVEAGAQRHVEVLSTTARNTSPLWPSGMATVVPAGE